MNKHKDKMKRSPRRNIYLKPALKIGYLILISFCSACTRAQPVERPNVIFLGVDDLRTELNSYGCSHMKTPNIDRLAAMGLQFNRAYVQQAVCAASRASFLTGCRPNTTTVNYPYNDYYTEEFVESHPTIPVSFVRSGYYTRTIGKIHHGFRDKGLTEDHYFPGQLPYPGRPELRDNQRSVWRDTVQPWAHPDLPDSEFQDGSIADETIATIRRANRSGKPFFIATGFIKPHLPFVCPKTYYDRYEHDSIQLSAHPELAPSQDSITAIKWGAHSWYNFLETGIDDEAARELKHHYQACVSFIDAQVGRILDELERSDLLENTIIMFWSDHGFHLGDHGIWTKQTNYELSTRVPLIVCVPQMSSAGQQTGALVEYVDLYPTLLELCGLEIPEWIEGLSMVPVLVDPGREWKKAAFSQYPRNGGKIEGYSVRTADFRYTEWMDNWSKGKVFFSELYDHRIDSLETVNLAGEEEYKSILDKHKEILRAGWENALPSVPADASAGKREQGKGKHNQSLVLSPNPVSKELSVFLSRKTTAGPCLISLFDLQGRLIKRKRHDVANAGCTLSMDEVASGIYLVRVMAGKSISTGIFLWS
jgi:arylsulfatase A-like enzyme